MPEMKKHMNTFSPCDFAFDLISFHVCPYRCLYRHTGPAQILFYFKYSKWLP